MTELSYFVLGFAIAAVIMGLIIVVAVVNEAKKAKADDKFEVSDYPQWVEKK